MSGQVAQSEAAQRAAVASYELAVQSAFADVDNALVAYLKTGEQLEAQQRLVSALTEYERLAKLQYDAGYDPYSTVLQAQQTLFPAQLVLAELRAAVLASSTNVYKAMGGGWIDQADALIGSSPTVSATTPAGTATTPAGTATYSDWHCYHSDWHCYHSLRCPLFYCEPVFLAGAQLFITLSSTPRVVFLIPRY